MISFDRGKTLHILGIIHRDISNGKSITDWLYAIKPRKVTLEFSRYGFIFRKEKGPMYLAKIESVLTKMRQRGEQFNEEMLSFLKAYIDLPSEYDAASLYCNETGASLHLVDMDRFSYSKLKYAEELFNEDNIRKYLGTCDEPTNSNERVMARLFFDSGIQTAPYTEEMRVRDRHMSRRIGILMQSDKDKRITHITGWQHLKDPYNIFTHFDPVKIFPYD